MNRLRDHFRHLEEREMVEFAKLVSRFCLTMYRVHAEAGEMNLARCVAALDAKAKRFLSSC